MGVGVVLLIGGVEMGVGVGRPMFRSTQYEFPEIMAQPLARLGFYGIVSGVVLENVGSKMHE